MRGVAFGEDRVRSVTPDTVSDLQILGVFDEQDTRPEFPNFETVNDDMCALIDDEKRDIFYTRLGGRILRGRLCPPVRVRLASAGYPTVVRGLENYWPLGAPLALLHNRGRVVQPSVEALSRQRSRAESGTRTDRVSCCCDGILPPRRRFGSQGPQRRSGDEVGLKIECVVDGSVHVEEALGRASRLDRCILRSLRRTTWWEFSARLFARSPCS